MKNITLVLLTLRDNLFAESHFDTLPNSPLIIFTKLGVPRFRSQYRVVSSEYMTIQIQPNNLVSHLCK